MWTRRDSNFWLAQLAAPLSFPVRILVIHCPFSLVAQMVKNWPAVQKTRVWSLGQEDPLENGMAIHCSILAWRIPRTEETSELQPWGCKESDITDCMLLLRSRVSRVWLFCDPVDCRPPGSSVRRILQARILEWVAISFSNACMHAVACQLSTNWPHHIWI